MTDLPPLEIDCPHCTPQHIQDANALAINAWNEEEQAAYNRFASETTSQWSVYDEWTRSTAYRELQDRKPEPPGVGCVECDWTQKVLTPAGREVLAFVNRRTGR